MIWNPGLRVMTLTAAFACFAHAQSPAPTSSVGYSTLYIGADGESHFRDGGSLELSLPRSAERADGDMYFHTMDGVTSVMLTRLKAGMTEDWHASPQRMFVFGIEGAVEMTASDGTTRVVGPGDMLLLEDTSGKGHLTHVPGDVDYVGLGVLIKDSAPVTGSARGGGAADAGAATAALRADIERDRD